MFYTNNLSALMASCGFLFMLAAPQASAVQYAAPPPALTEAEMAIDDNIPFEERIKKHVNVVYKAQAIRAWASDQKNIAVSQSGTAKDYENFNDEYMNANKILLPYSIANEQATALRGQSYILNIDKESVCKNDLECTPVDAITATMMFYQEAATSGPSVPSNTSEQGVNPEAEYRTVTCGTTQIKIQGQEVCIIIDLIRDKPIDVLSFGIVPAVRDAVIPADDTGEIAQMIRDPIKRPVEIIQNIRDDIIDPSDNGEVAKTIRDPIKCTVGKLFGKC